jgi:hypothetical protein
MEAPAYGGRRPSRGPGVVRGSPLRGTGLRLDAFDSEGGSLPVHAYGDAQTNPRSRRRAERAGAQYD